MKRQFIGDIAERLKLNPRTIRYYEKIGLLPSPTRTDSRYRVYTEKTVERLEFIIKAKALGLKLHEIKVILLLHDQGQLPCDHTRAFIMNKMAEIESKIADLTILKTKLHKILELKSENKFLDTICPMIEAFDKNA